MSVAPAPQPPMSIAPPAAPVPPAAPAPPPKPDLVLRPTLDKTRGHVGDVFTYTLRIVHDPAERFLVPGEPSFAPFDLKGRDFFKRTLEDGKVEETFLFRIAVYKTGVHRVPALDLPYVDRSGRTRRAVAQDLDVTIESLLPPGGEIPAPKDVKPPLPVRVRDWRLLWALGLFAGAALLALFAWIAYRYGKKLAARPRPAPPPPPPRPAHLVAYEKLARVRLPTTEGEMRVFYELVSNVVREYYGNRYGILALDMTTSELLAALRPLGAPGLDLRETSRFLSEADLVKFAKFLPGAGDPERYLEKARALIEATREHEPAPEEAKAA